MLLRNGEGPERRFREENGSVGAVGGLGMEWGAGVAVREERRRRGWRGWRRGRGCSPFLLVAGSGGLENRDQVEWRGGESE